MATDNALLAAVHAVQAYFVMRGRYPVTHTQRDSSIQRDPHLRNIYVDYREMENLSRDARYDTVPITADDVQIAKGCLDRIRAHIGQLV